MKNNRVEGSQDAKKKTIVIYSGGLDTSVCIPLLREEYGYKEIITVTVDVGQPPKEIKSAEKKARILKTQHFTMEAKEEFVKDFVFPAIKANGSYQGYPLSTALARPLIAAKAVEVAKKTGVSTFAHGCTGKGNDQFRIEFTLRSLLPQAEIIAPMREKNLTRQEEIEYAKTHRIPISQTKEKIWSIDENLWGRSIEGGRLEDPNFPPPEEIYAWTKGGKVSSPVPQNVVIEFENGIPIGLNNRREDGLNLILKLNKIAGNCGIGRVDIMEDRILGLKVRENYESPAATVLLTAHKALEALVLTREEQKFKALIDTQWAELVYFGLWYDPLREDLEGFINTTQKRVKGVVKLQLFKGNIKILGRESPWALYSKDLASFESKTFDQRLAEGMVKYYGLSQKLYQLVKQKEEKKGF